jgi:hypothetical protein
LFFSREKDTLLKKKASYADAIEEPAAIILFFADSENEMFGQENIITFSRSHQERIFSSCQTLQSPKVTKSLYVYVEPFVRYVL